MPWIFLRVKLPTNPSPPKMSIHHAVESKMTVNQRREFIRKFKIYPPDGSEINFDDDSEVDALDVESMEKIDDNLGWGHVPNETAAMLIQYKGTTLKVFPHEFSNVNARDMKVYLFGTGKEESSHELVPNSEADSALLRSALETDLQGIFDAALVDGCTPEMAKAVAMGVNVSDEDIEFPAIGWYRCKPEIAEIFCEDHEMEE